jgi:hypothetical protein
VVEQSPFSFLEVGDGEGFTGHIAGENPYRTHEKAFDVKYYPSNTFRCVISREW